MTTTMVFALSIAMAAFMVVIVAKVDFCVEPNENTNLVSILLSAVPGKLSFSRTIIEEC